MTTIFMRDLPYLEILIDASKPALEKNQGNPSEAMRSIADARTQYDEHFDGRNPNSRLKNAKAWTGSGGNDRTDKWRRGRYLTAVRKIPDA
jgi:hypothetical protein